MAGVGPPSRPQGRQLSRLAGPSLVAYRGFVLLVAACLVTTTAIGLAAAFRLSTVRRRVWLSVLAGTLLPALLYLLGRR